MAKPKPSKKHRKNRRDTERVVRWLRAGAVVTGIGAAVINGQPRRLGHRIRGPLHRVH